MAERHSGDEQLTSWQPGSREGGGREKDRETEREEERERERENACANVFPPSPSISSNIFSIPPRPLAYGLVPLTFS
jgi:hypothetical protein